MSTKPHNEMCALVEKLENEGKLVRFVPRLVGPEECLRRVSVSPRINKWLHGGGQNLALKASVRTHFKIFSIGELVDDRDFMKRVERRDATGSSTFDDKVWSVRPFMTPKHRFFSVFVVPDWLLIFNMQSRAFLGHDNTRWNLELEKACKAWGALFPGLQKLNFSCFADVVTFNSQHLDDRWNEA